MGEGYAQPNEVERARSRLAQSRPGAAPGQAGLKDSDFPLDGFPGQPAVIGRILIRLLQQVLEDGHSAVIFPGVGICGREFDREKIISRVFVCQLFQDPRGVEGALLPTVQDGEQHSRAIPLVLTFLGDASHVVEAFFLAAMQTTYGGEQLYR